MFYLASTLYYICIFSVLIPIIFFLKGKESFKVTSIKVLGILLFISVFSDLSGYLLIKLKKSNIPLSNIYFVVQFFLLSYIYYLLLKTKTIIYIALVIFISFFIISTLFIHPIYEDQSWSNFVGGILLIIYSIKYYSQILNKRIDLLRFSFFWINTSIFLYFSFNLCLYLFATTNYIMKNMDFDTNMLAWSFHSLSSIIKNILFAIAIFYVGAKQYEIYDGRDMTKI